MLKRFSLILFLQFLSFSCFAAGGVSGTISSINIKETGYILITLDAPHANPMGCERVDMVAIANNHVAKKEILSVVLAAHATMKPAAFWITDCYHQYGTSYPVGITASIHQQ